VTDLHITTSNKPHHQTKLWYGVSFATSGHETAWALFLQPCSLQWAVHLRI